MSELGMTTITNRIDFEDGSFVHEYEDGVKVSHDHASNVTLVIGVNGGIFWYDYKNRTQRYWDSGTAEWGEERPMPKTEDDWPFYYEEED